MFGVIIQARLGSKRLPNKVFKTIGNKNLLEHIVINLKRYLKCSIIIATTKNKKDDKLAKWCKKKNLKVYRGEESNVLKRYYLCSSRFKFKHIIRITSDNPFTDIKELKKMKKIYKKKRLDYISNIKSVPKGMGSEIISFKALKLSLNNSTKRKHFEHVNEYILDNLGLFKFLLVKCKDKNNKIMKLNYSIDTKKNLNSVRKIFNKVEGDVNSKKLIDVSI